LNPTPTGTEFRDAVCPVCHQGYELKSSARVHGGKVSDGGYDSMMRSIVAADAPALMLMNYSRDWSVRRLVAVHPVFLTPEVVVKRKKPHIRPKSKLPYWMCDLNLSLVPPDGRILLVSDGIVRPSAETRRKFRESARFGAVPLDQRGWTALVLAKVRKLRMVQFTNDDVYAFADEIHAVYPGNNNIKAKIRQQLQELVRIGYIERIAAGKYRVSLGL
jgi:type II restriction enzyme